MPISTRRRFLSACGTLVVATVGLTALSGCDPRAALYFLQPFEPTITAPCPPLKGKRVVILTSATAGVQTDAVGVESDIARGIARVIREKVKKVDVVDPAEVANWSRAAATWTDPADAAKAFDADVVIFLEIRQFQMTDPSSPGLFQGKANTAIRVVELAHPKDTKGKPKTGEPKQAEIIYEGERETTFPVHNGIPMETGVGRSAFKTKFLKIVIDELSWHFVDHAPGDSIQDAKLGD